MTRRAVESRRAASGTRRCRRASEKPWTSSPTSVVAPPRGDCADDRPHRAGPGGRRPARLPRDRRSSSRSRLDRGPHHGRVRAGRQKDVLGGLERSAPRGPPLRARGGRRVSPGDGRTLPLVAVDGREPGWERRRDAAGLAALLIEAGAWSALGTWQRVAARRRCRRRAPAGAGRVRNQPERPPRAAGGEPPRGPRPRGRPRGPAAESVRSTAPAPASGGAGASARRSWCRRRDRGEGGALDALDRAAGRRGRRAAMREGLRRRGSRGRPAPRPGSRCR
ncbi:MAG: hypothetical protein MZW92_56460 [Comamonadaceae bacterium]|nr:hypothetical protein [Comamonadaceae bacterium]